MADVSDPALKATVDLIKSDQSETNWCAFGYEGQKKIVLKAVGKGGHSEMTSFCREDEVLFLFLRLMDGDKESKRVKFVFITFVGEHVGGMPRGRVGSHMSNIKPLFGQFNVEFRADNVAEMSMSIITKKLKVAGGADYDTGANAAGYKSSGNLRQNALKAYQEKEKEGNIKQVVYVTSALPKETPVDLTGRPMVAPPTEALKNINMQVGSKQTRTPQLSEVARNRPTKAKPETASKPEPVAKPATAAKTVAKASATATAPATKPVVAKKNVANTDQSKVEAAPESEVSTPFASERAGSEEDGSQGCRASIVTDTYVSDDPEERARLRAERRKQKREEAALKAQAEVAALRASLAPEQAAEDDEAIRRQEQEEQAAAQALEEKALAAAKAKAKQEAAAARQAAEAEEERAEAERAAARAKAREEAAAAAEAASVAAADKKKKASLFDEEDDEDDELFKPKSAPSSETRGFTSPSKNPFADEMVTSTVIDHDDEEITVTFGALRQFLSARNVLTDFHGSPSELVALIKA